MPRCANPACGEKFTRPQYAPSFQNWCSVDCGIVIARQKQIKADKKRQKARRQELLTPQQVRSKAIKKAEKAARDYVRLRDKEKPCISCGSTVEEVESRHYTTGGYWDAGHYLGKGAHPGLRLNILNIHKQCKWCNGGENRRRSGAKRESVREGYRKNLIDKVGLDYVYWLEGPHDPLNMDLDYFERYRAIFCKKYRHLVKLRNE